jgi:hypothetical protein
MMCDESVLNLQKSLQSPATRMPKIKLQRVEEILPSMRETLVSVYACVQRNGMLQTPSLAFQVERNYIFCNKHKLFVNFHFHSFMIVVVHIKTV